MKQALSHLFVVNLLSRYVYVMQLLQELHADDCALGGRYVWHDVMICMIAGTDIHYTQRSCMACLGLLLVHCLLHVHMLDMHRKPYHVHEMMVRLTVASKL